MLSTLEYASKCQQVPASASKCQQVSEHLQKEDWEPLDNVKYICYTTYIMETSKPIVPSY